MIGTEFIDGQGLGNQLFLYVVARCMAIERNTEFGTAFQNRFANNIHSNKGSYFMDIDLGTNIENIQKYKKYYEKDDRLFIPNSKHDIEHGCYVTGIDGGMFDVEDDTLIYGNCQAEGYFLKYKKEIKDWLKVFPQYEKWDFCDDNICVLNMRGGEYVNCRELFLNKVYWQNAMKYMKKKNPLMSFIIITEDVETAKFLFPDIPSFHLGMGEDYVAIKNAKHVILSNSSFAFWPVFTSDTIETIVAPKYWARFNVSNGYWASEQNIYTGWNYMDRKGEIFTDKQCKEELENFKKCSAIYKRVNQKPNSISMLGYKLIIKGKEFF